MSSRPGPYTMAQFVQLQRDNEMLREQLRQIQEMHGSAVFGDGIAVSDSLPEPVFVQEPIGDSCAVYSSDSSASAVSTNSSRGRAPNDSDGALSTESTVSLRRRSSGAYVVRVEFGLLGNLPSSLWVSERRSPCAVFAVVDAESGETSWRFVKDYEQLRNFHDLLLSSLAPLIRASKVHLAPFPYRSQRDNLFTTTTVQPWYVDVRNDMLNAYFKSVSRLSHNKYVQRNSGIRNEVERAVAALWLHNLVDIPPRNVLSSQHDGEMHGFLLSRRPGDRSWKTRFYTINGAFLDIQDHVGKGKVNESIPLSGAHIQLKITLYDTSEGDERYAFTIYEKSSLSRAHSFTAENEQTREKWISKLRNRVAKIGAGDIRADRRFYSAENLPVPFESRESPHKTQFLDSAAKQVPSSRPTSAKSSEVATHRKPSSVPTISPPSDPRRSRVYLREGSRGKIKEELAKLAVYESLYPGGSEDRMDFFSGVDSTTESESISERSVIPGSPIEKLNLKAARTRNRHLRRHTEDFVQSPLTPITGASVLVVGKHDFAERRGSFQSGSHAVEPRLQNSVFGVMPEDCKFLCHSASGELVPTVVSRCIERLNEPGAVKEIGIFRTSGTQTQIDVLQEEFDRKGDYDIVKCNIDVHTSADLLKRYLRMLPRSLFGEWDELKAKSVLGLQEEDQVRVLRIEMGEVKKINRAVISSTLATLQRVREQELHNAMSLRNLGVALSPSLKVPSPILELFIKHYCKIF